MMPQHTIPDNETVTAFLALPMVQRGEHLHQMTPTRRVAYAVAVGRRDGRAPYRVLDTFAAWMQVYLNSLQEVQA